VTSKKEGNVKKVIREESQKVEEESKTEPKIKVPEPVEESKAEPSRRQPVPPRRIIRAS
jgi:hypothetical protein